MGPERHASPVVLEFKIFNKVENVQCLTTSIKIGSWLWTHVHIEPQGLLGTTDELQVMAC